MQAFCIYRNLYLVFSNFKHSYMAKPNAVDYPEYFGKYISLVNEDNLYDAFKNQFPKLELFLGSIDETRSSFAYAPGKWTLKELLQHTIDTERIFNYRALCYARKEPASLPGFDENLYAENSNGNGRDWNSLINEMINVRRSTEDLYKSFTEEMLALKGTANNKTMTVLGLGYTTIGHVYHHINIVNERYLK